MPKIKVLPHPQLCPQGAELTAQTGEVIIDVLLKNKIHIEHACDMQCACTTCHVYIRAGAGSLNAPQESEEDMLDKAWGLDLDSRLSCQTIVDGQDITVEIPKYTINLVAEDKS